MIHGELIVDNFAGGGGASTGIELATGYSVDIAINHDPEAIRMLKQKAIVEGQGWCSCYICLPCVENWLEESGQVEEHG